MPVGEFSKAGIFNKSATGARPHSQDTPCVPPAKAGSETRLGLSARVNSCPDTKLKTCGRRHWHKAPAGPIRRAAAPSPAAIALTLNCRIVSIVRLTSRCFLQKAARLMASQGVASRFILFHFGKNLLKSLQPIGLRNPCVLNTLRGKRQSIELEWFIYVRKSNVWNTLRGTKQAVELIGLSLARKSNVCNTLRAKYSKQGLYYVWGA